jgi:hypothetical protein
MKTSIMIQQMTQYKYQLLLSVLCIEALLGKPLMTTAVKPQVETYILQGVSQSTMRAAVEGVGGTVSRQFTILKAIAAR